MKFGFRHMAAQPEVTNLRPDTAAAYEPIHALAARLLYMHGKGQRGLAVCSVAEGDGASFTAASVALAMADSGLSTLLIDADLKTPGLMAFIPGEAGGPGLSELLTSDQLSIGDVLQTSPLPNLSVIHAGAIGSASDSLVGSVRFETLVEDCVREFDFTIIDTPPARSSADTMRIIGVIRYAMIVARRDGSYMDDIAALTRQIGTVGGHLVGSTLIEA